MPFVCLDFIHCKTNPVISCPCDVSCNYNAFGLRSLYFRRLEPQTRLDKSMKTKRSCQRILSNLKVFLSKWYRKLPNPSSCSCRNGKQDYLFYEDILSGLAESDQDSVVGSMDKKRLIPRKEDDIDANNGSFLKFLKASPSKKVKNQVRSPRKESKRADVQNCWSREAPYSKQEHCASFLLEQKMRELEMMGMDDLEHALDIEEVLHCYSRLNTPVYIDIVDKFVTHIWAETYTPQSSSESEF